MTRLLLDTSVLIKWFHEEGEAELGPARALRDAHRTGAVDCLVLDLAVYEVGNVLSRALRWEASDVAAQLADLLVIVGLPLVMDPRWMPDAAELASRHRLSFYDASWAAAARGLAITLVSADGALVEAGLAETPTATAARLRLT